MMFAAVFLGFIDIISGLVILFNIHTDFSFILFLIMLLKGLMSMMADTIGKIYGALDIIAGVIILFGINIGSGFSVALFLFFVYKGIVSIVPRYI